MDPQSVAFTPQADAWHLSNTMRNVQEVQQDHADRLSRLERRQDEDARVKSVWGPTSPFPSVLSGTPQQGPSRHQSTADFTSFDDDQSNNMIRSLHLDAEEEPRRGGATSRANSVRFDESANQNQWPHASKTSLDMNSRTSSGFGGLPGLGGHAMLDRSSSHKSDGRHSSAGQSATSGRANSLGLDITNPSAHANSQPPSVAPVYYILGSVPSIIRCWLNTDFKSESILYAAVCTGSYKSYLDMSLINHLGFRDLVGQDINGEKKIKLPMFLPEAVPQSTTSKASASPPRLPSFMIDFTAVDNRQNSHPQAIQIFIGSDVLRTHNADILMSSNSMTMYDDDDRSKWSIPLVRPENDATFKSLYVTSALSSTSRPVAGPTHDILTAVGSSPSNGINGGGPATGRDQGPSPDSTEDAPASTTRPLDTANGKAQGDEHDEVKIWRASERHRKPSLSAVITSRTDTGDAPETSPPPASGSKSGSSAIWNNWRRDASNPAPPQAEWANTSRAANANYNRPNRDGGIKVLKPTRQPSRSSNAPLVSSPTVTGQSRFFDDGKRRNGTGPTSATGPGSDSGDSSTQPRRSISGDASNSRAGLKENNPLLSAKPRGANPIGGASAFGWLNSGSGAGK